MEELRQALVEVAARATELADKPADVVLRWAMGQVMPRFTGRLAPPVVRERLAAALRFSASEVRA